MDKVTYVKSQLKLEHWRRLIADCQSSGMKAKYWCAQHVISKDQYYYWLWKVREEYVENLPAEATSMPSCHQERIAFRPLEVQSPMHGMRAEERPKMKLHLMHV